MPRFHNVDLHTHSTASDGFYSPEQLVAEAAAAGVELLALTDHDSVSGLAAAQQAADEHGIQLISGTELSVTWQGKTLHIVGLNFDPEHSELQQGIQQLQALRTDRAQRMAAKLEKLGLEDAWARAAALAGVGGHVARPHFARLLIESGLVKDSAQAFKKYLKFGKPGYVANTWVELSAAIGWIKAAGGTAVLAHPLRYNMTASWRQRALAAFTDCGGDALEICNGSGNKNELLTNARDAKAHGLQGSMGSDFHHPAQRWIRLGRLPTMPADIQPVWQHWLN